MTTGEKAEAGEQVFFCSSLVTHHCFGDKRADGSDG